MNRRNFFRLSFGAAMAAACAPLAAAMPAGELAPSIDDPTGTVFRFVASENGPIGVCAGYYSPVSIETLKVNVLLDALQRDAALPGALARQGLRVDPSAIRQLFKPENSAR